MMIRGTVGSNFMSNIQSHAIIAGVISFIAVYALGGMLIIVAMVILADRVDNDVLMQWLRVGGYLALAFPAYVSARAAKQAAILHALLMGLIEGIGVVLLMMFTFSFEGTLQEHVINRMLPVFGGVLAMCAMAGGLAEWKFKREESHR